MYWIRNTPCNYKSLLQLHSKKLTTTLLWSRQTNRYVQCVSTGLGRVLSRPTSIIVYVCRSVCLLTYLKNNNDRIGSVLLWQYPSMFHIIGFYKFMKNIFLSLFLIRISPIF